MLSAEVKWVCVALKKACTRGSCYQKESVNASLHRHGRSKTTCCLRAGVLLPFSLNSQAEELHGGSSQHRFLAAAKQEVQAKRVQALQLQPSRYPK